MRYKGNHFDLLLQTFSRLFSPVGKNNRPTRQDKPKTAGGTIADNHINNNHVTYDDLKTILGVDRSTITRNIAVLKEKGVIRRVGEDKNGYWEVLSDIKIVD